MPHNINYKSDFDFILNIASCVRREDGTCEKTPLGWPGFDWVATFWTSNRANAYVASRRGDELVNCFDDNGQIHIVVDNHHLGKGPLKVEFHALLPDGIYPDNIRDTYDPQPIDIELVAGSGDCATTVEAELLLPMLKGEPFTYEDFTPEQLESLRGPKGDKGDKGYKGDKGDKGDAFTYSDFTPAQIAELQKPALDKVADVDVALKKVDAKEKEITAAESKRETDEKARIAAEDAREANEKKRIADTQTWKNELSELKTEVNTSVANAQTATSEATTAATNANQAATNANTAADNLSQTIAAKQNKLTTTDDLNISPDNLLSLTDMAKKRLFIDEWNTLCGTYGRYNEATGYFELNGLTDITYEQALNIMALGNRMLVPNSYTNYENIKIRTNLPPCDLGTGKTIGGFIFNGQPVEVVNMRLFNNSSNATILGKAYAMIGNCAKIERIIGTLDISTATSSRNDAPILKCPMLREVFLTKLTNGFYLGECKSINYESISYMIDNAANTKEIQVYVHPNVYAKLTGDTTNAAAAALSEEELAEWMALLPLAAEKNIQFASA